MLADLRPAEPCQQPAWDGRRLQRQRHHHYHLDIGKLARATLSDANARRPPKVFAQTFAMLSRRPIGKRVTRGRRWYG